LFVADFAPVTHVATNGKVRRVVRTAILEREYMVDLRGATDDDATTIGACIGVAYQDRLP
jgi:hypothetical protein